MDRDTNTSEAELPSSGRTSQRVGRFVRRTMRNVLILYLGVVVIFYWLQTKMIFPGSRWQGTREAQLAAPPRHCELLDLKTVDGQPIKALFARALDAQDSVADAADALPTMLYFYGNGMALVDTLDEVDAFRRLGVNVLVADYVGFGMSGGQPSEQGCYATADAAYQWLVDRSPDGTPKVISAGWSLGAAVAADLASRRPVAALMMFSPFTSLTDTASYHYPWLPVDWLLVHRFESAKKLPSVTCPVLLAHGRRDEIIPFSMCERLASVARGPVERVAIDRGGHNDFWPVGIDEVLPAMRQVIVRLSE